MTLYAGENIIITHTATSIDDVALTNEDVTSVALIIYDSDGVEVLAETEMTWNATYSRWQYNWDTSEGSTPTPLDYGTYKAKITVQTLDGSRNWEIKRIRLARNPVGEGV